MSKEKPYGMEKDLKVLKGSSNRHSARLEGRFIGIFPSTPIGPEVEKETRKGAGSQIVKEVQDPRIRIDLKVEETKMGEGPFFELLSLLGLEITKGDFEVLSTMEKVLRALAKANFKNLAELRLNGNLVYEHPEKEWDLRDILSEIRDMGSDLGELEEAEARVIEGEEGDMETNIKVDKVHTGLKHDIDIKFEGELDGEMLRRVINYLEDNLEIEELLKG